MGPECPARQNQDVPSLLALTATLNCLMAAWLQNIKLPLGRGPHPQKVPLAELLHDPAVHRGEWI